MFEDSPGALFDGIQTTGVKYDATGSTNNLVYTLGTPIKLG